MRGTKERSAAVASGACRPLGRCLATGLVIAGLLLLAAGTVLAYSEWQSQVVPESFGPDVPAEVPRREAGPGDSEGAELPAEGAVALPPMEVAPGPESPEEGHRLAFPLVRRGDADLDADLAAEAQADPGWVARRVPRVPSWVDSVYARPPAEVGAGSSPLQAYPPPGSPDAPPTISPLEPTTTPVPTPVPSPTPYPPASAAPTHIQIPAINLDAPVVPVGSREVDYHGQPVRVWNVADYAAGWHETSLYPGQGGNVVISGHNNIRGEVFRDIVDLEAGAEVILTADGRPYIYVVESKMILPERGRPFEERLENNRWIGYFEDERLTLVTCWPYTSNTHRVIVIARLRQ